MIIDAGGGTVDLSAYTFTTTVPVVVEEIAAAQCKCLLGAILLEIAHFRFTGILQGSTRVNIRAREFLKGEFLIIVSFIAVCVKRTDNQQSFATQNTETTRT